MPSNERVCQMNKLFNSDESMAHELEVEPSPEGTIIQDCDDV
jgi:hypothetical protein